MVESGGVVEEETEMPFGSEPPSVPANSGDGGWRCGMCWQDGYRGGVLPRFNSASPL